MTPRHGIGSPADRPQPHDRTTHQHQHDDEHDGGPHGATWPQPDLDRPPEGERWSTWDGAQHAPVVPGWLVTELGAVDTDLGVLKTGKEADVHVLRRYVPGTDRSCHLAAKRYRAADRKLFHRDAGYLEGRRVRRSREMRAVASRTRFGKQVISGMWAGAEFACLVRLHELGLPVPAPVSIDGTEMLMELVGDTSGPTPVAAPRLASTRPSPALLADLYEQLRRTLLSLAAEGWAHGDLSPYNILLDGERLVVIDWPQVVDVIGNPHGFDILARDAQNVVDWFVRRGLQVDAGELVGELVAQATNRW